MDCIICVKCDVITICIDSRSGIQWNVQGPGGPGEVSMKGFKEFSGSEFKGFHSKGFSQLCCAQKVGMGLPLPPPKRRLFLLAFFVIITTSAFAAE